MNIVDTSMIVTYTDKGWEIITQRTHGLLAAQIASNWRVKDRSRRWLETMLAIAEHDDAQIELERDDLLTELGGPFNFDMRRFDLDHCKRTYEFSISKSRYIAILNLMHLQFVYGKEVKNDLSALKLMTSVSRDIRQFTVLTGSLPPSTYRFMIRWRYPKVWRASEACQKGRP